MAMVVKNNMTAKQTLNRLDKNSKALSKSLKKVASGMKLNSAADDASGFSISEKMRVQIRALDQANANAQNAGSLLQTAEGAASSTVDILKTLKEKAINAANDTNTDIDRATIQKEMDQAIDQISDNANVTFNGIRIFDGGADISKSVQDTIIKALNSEWLKASFEMIQDAYGINFTDGRASVTEMEVLFKNEGPGTLAYVTSTPNGDITGALTLTINMDYYDDLDESSPDGQSPSSGTQYLDRVIAHELTHAVMSANIRNWGDVPKFVTEGMAEVTHGIDDNRTSDLRNLKGIVDAGLAAARGSNESNSYSVGYAFMRYMNKQFGDNSVKGFVQGMAQYGGDAAGVDKAVNAATGGRYSKLDDLKAAFKADVVAAATSESFLLDKCGIDLDNPDVGSILGADANQGEVRDDKGTVLEGLNTKFWYYPSANSTLINGLTVKWPDFQKGEGMKFQVGTRANQVINSAFGSISAEGLGLKADNGTNLSVGTRVKAKQAMTILDNAIEKVLDQQTNIGAIESRLKYTQANLTTASENTVSAESVIRDADMAKEMTEYTKNNVLMQAAQSMLAQANQNSSGVLGLLQ